MNADLLTKIVRASHAVQDAITEAEKPGACYQDTLDNLFEALDSLRMARAGLSDPPDQRDTGWLDETPLGQQYDGLEF